MATGEAAFGDADGFLCTSTPCYIGCLFTKIYRHIKAYTHKSTSIDAIMFSIHTAAKAISLSGASSWFPNLLLCKYIFFLNIHIFICIYIYIYVRHVEQRDSNVSRPEIYQLKFLACLMFSGALSRPAVTSCCCCTCGCCAGHSMKLTHGAEEFHALFSRAALSVDTSRNSEERDVFSRSEKWLLSPPTARHESCLSREEEVCMNGFVQELINWAN